MRWQGEEQSSNVEDRRSMRGPAVAIGGGGLLVIMLISMFLGVDPQKILQQVEQMPANGPAEERELSPQEKQQGEFIATVLRFTEVVWDEQFQKLNMTYEKPKVVLFSDSVETGCGNAPSAVGPFYCPRDRTVYLDPTFFEELEDKLGGSKAEFSQAYVLAHEIGHHVQNLLGYSEIVDEKRQTLPREEFNQWSVRLELQADYLAGVWAHYGQRKFQFIESGDIESAMTAANAIGDDRLQKRSTGFNSPENYTHGTSEQRVRWFREGLRTGDLNRLKELFAVQYEEL